MANKQYKDIVRKALAEFIRRLNIQYSPNLHALWFQEETRYGVTITSKVAVPAEDKFCWADFSLYFGWDSPLIQYKLHLNGKASHLLNRRHGIRDDLELQVNEALEYTCCIELGLLALYIGSAE